MRPSRLLAVAAVVAALTAALLPTGASASPMGTRVMSGDFPDPFVLRDGGRYYGYSTQVGVVDVPLAVSTDLRTWTPAGNAIGRLGSWARPGRTWAPAVVRRGAGYVLYYTAWSLLLDRQCIGMATAPTPAGPFVDLAAVPFVCQPDRNGSIDASPFVDDDGTLFLLWKSEDNALGQRTVLWSQQLTSDGTATVGVPRPLLQQSQRWEAPTVEGPTMVEHDGVYHLFYGGGWWESSGAGIGWATCASALGPCVKQSSGPWLATAAGASGRAGPEVFTDERGTLKLAHHAWPDAVGYAVGGRRTLYIGTLGFTSRNRPVLRSL